MWGLVWDLGGLGLTWFLKVAVLEVKGFGGLLGSEQLSMGGDIGDRETVRTSTTLHPNLYTGTVEKVIATLANRRGFGRSSCKFLGSRYSNIQLAMQDCTLEAISTRLS